MSKQGVSNLPAITPSDMVGIMIQDIFHRSVKSRYQMMPFSGLAESLNSLHPYEKIKKGISHLQVWREYEGLTFQEMADKLDVPVKEYLDMEAEATLIPFKKLKRLCQALRLHPVEIYNPNSYQNCDQHDEMVALLCDAYENPTNYVMLSGELHQDLIEVLQGESDRNRSYDVLSERYDEIKSTSDENPLNSVTNILKKLLINDGNDYLGRYVSPTEFINNEIAKLKNEHASKVAEMDLEEIVNRGLKEHVDDFANPLFGKKAQALIEKWTSCNADDSFDCSFRDFVDREAWRHALPMAYDEGLDRFSAMLKNYVERLDRITSLSVEIDNIGDRVIAVERFAEDYEDELNAYDIRQRILSVVHPKHVKPVGSANSSNSLDVPKVFFRKKLVSTLSFEI